MKASAEMPGLFSLGLANARVIAPREAPSFSRWDNVMMLNADPQELAKFSDLAHRWWDPESEFRPLHQINPLRLEWIDALAGVAGKQVLDVGCCARHGH
jgi:hypothetical protein